MGTSAHVVVLFALGSLLVPTAAWVAVLRNQGFQKPTIQEGPVEIRGTVNVGNAPVVEARQSGTWAVDAKQSGTWSVQVQDGAAISTATPAFLVVDRTYEFRWSDDRVETYRVVDLTPSRSSAGQPAPPPGGWVLAEPAGAGAAGRRYLNVSRAISIMPVAR